MVRQEANMHRRRRKHTPGDCRAETCHDAKPFGGAITVDQVSADGEAGASLSGNACAFVAHDVSLGWDDIFAAGSPHAEEVVAWPQHLAGPTDAIGHLASNDAMERIAARKQPGSCTGCRCRGDRKPMASLKARKSSRSAPSRMYHTAGGRSPLDAYVFCAMPPKEE